MVRMTDLDLLDLESELSADEILTRNAVREFAERRVRPIADECFLAGRFPAELVPELAEMGLLGCSLQGYGCAGVSAMQYGLISQELEAADASVRSFVSAQSSLCMYPIHAFGSEEQKQRWLPPMARGETIGCFGLTEPDAGSNPSAMRTRAVKSDRGYVLDGTKTWITNGGIAHLALVWAKLDGRIRGFLVERGTPGFSTNDIKRKHSLRATVTSELVLEECEVPPESLLPGSDGLKSTLACLTQGRFGVAWGALGSAIVCYHEAREHALVRKQWGDRPIASHQLVQAKLAQMALDITKAQWLTYRVTRLKEAGRAQPHQVSMIKLENTEMARAVVRAAREILGGNGVSAEYPVMRHLCDLETLVTYEGTSDIQRLIIGHALTGIPAFA
jgi:glutaryl-CoA dehydrogenase